MQSPSLKVRWLLAIAIIAIPTAFFGSAIFKRVSLPKDADLVAQFQKNQGSFKELVQMFKAHEKVQSIRDSAVTSEPYKDATLAEVELSSTNYSISLQLLKKCGASAAIRDEEEIRFPVAGWGWASKGYRIAITYRETEPSPIIPSLDDFRKTKDEWEQAYRKIEDNWYLWIIW